MRRFAGLELGEDGIPPDETTILNFRHLLDHYKYYNDDRTHQGKCAVGEHLKKHYLMEN